MSDQNGQVGQKEKLWKVAKRTKVAENGQNRISEKNVPKGRNYRNVQNGDNGQMSKMVKMAKMAK